MISPEGFCNGLSLETRDNFLRFSISALENFYIFRKNRSYIEAHYMLNGVDRCKFDYTLRFALESFKTQSHDASFSAYSKSLFVSVNVTNKKKILILGIRNLYLTYPRGKVYIKDYPRILRNQTFLLLEAKCVLAISKTRNSFKNCCQTEIQRLF